MYNKPSSQQIISKFYELLHKWITNNSTNADKNNIELYTVYQSGAENQEK